MSDFGGKLRLARERRGISLRQIAASTKISIGALEALERNDISKLPGGIFSRAFVRSYAVEVGLDPDVTVREFLDRFQAEPATSTAVQAVPDEESTFESQRRMAGVVLTLVLISIPLVGIILYFTMRTRPARVTPAAAAVEAPMAPPPEPPTQAPPSAPALQSAPADPAPKTMTLELRATADCWIGLTVDGASIMRRVMRAGEKDVREVRTSAVVEVGNAGAFAYSINGRPGKPLGQLGQVRTLRLTKDTMAQYLQ
jgi:cytoskeletal protein RodZ